MEFTNTFEVPLPPEETFQILIDLERVAPCMPGAKLFGKQDGIYEGEVRLKVGPMTLTYTGTAEMLEVDEAAKSAVIKARGREKRGAGTAAATVRAQLAGLDDGRTQVTVATDLDITGKPAQFGRGVMADIGAQLISTFADNLVQDLAPAHESGALALPHDESATSAATDVSASGDSVLDLGRIGSQALARRSGPVLAALASLLVFVWMRRRIRHS